MKIDEEEIVILFDNAPCHSDSPNFHFPNREMKTLSKYSPFLNMTELANIALKVAVKSHLSQPSTIAQLNDNLIAYNNGITLCHHGMSILKPVVSELSLIHI